MPCCRHHKSRFHAPRDTRIGARSSDILSGYCHGYEIDSFRSTRKIGSAAVSPEGHVPAGRGTSDNPRDILSNEYLEDLVTFSTYMKAFLMP